MKLTGPLSSLCVVLPFFVLQGSAAPFNFGGKDNGRGFLGNFGGAAAPAASAAPPAGAAKAAGAAGAANVTAAGAAGAAAAGAGAAAAAAAGGDPQTSLTLDPRVIGANLAKNGLAAQEAGQVASLTSTNNFINFCLGKTITDGLQVQAGSCNPVPMGDIPSKTNQPTAKFVVPTNLANFGVNQPFTVKMAIQGLVTGNFVNPNTNYFAAPQQLNKGGVIVGHSHFVIQQIASVTSTKPADPTVFAFFLGLNAAAQNGILSATVTKGLPAGAYRISSINTAANHQPVIGPVAQHGAFDDITYFTVGQQAAKAALKAVGGGGGRFDFNAANPAAAAAGAAAGNATAAPAAAAPAAAAAAGAGNATVA